MIMDRKMRLGLLYISLIVIFSGCQAVGNDQTYDIYQSSMVAMKAANSYGFEMEINQSILRDDFGIFNQHPVKLMATGKMREEPLTVEMEMYNHDGKTVVDYYLNQDDLYERRRSSSDQWFIKENRQFGDELDTFQAEIGNLLAKERAGIELQMQEESYLMVIKNANLEYLEKIFVEIVAEPLEKYFAELADGNDLDTNKIIVDVRVPEMQIWIDKINNFHQQYQLDMKIAIVCKQKEAVINQRVFMDFQDHGKYEDLQIPADIMTEAIDYDQYMRYRLPVYPRINE